MNTLRWLVLLAGVPEHLSQVRKPVNDVHRRLRVTRPVGSAA